MDQAVLVDGQIDGGKKRLEQLADAGVDITVAFWAKAADEDSWYLYIASKDVDDVGAQKTYRKVHAAISKDSVAVPWVDRFQIKLIRTDTPAAKAAIKYASPIISTFYRRPYLGDLAIEEAYIYPVPLPQVSAT